MRNANGRVGLVDVLTASAGRSICVDSHICRIEVHVNDLVRLRHNRHRARTGVDAPLRFRFRNALHPMHARFEFEFRISACTGYRRDDLLVAAYV